MGLNGHGDEAYIGLATHKGQTGPSELIISGSHSGLYFPYSKEVQHLTSNTSKLQYYAKEPNVDYQWLNSSRGAGVFESIKVLSPPYTFYVGRVFSFNSYHVGKVSLEHRVLYYGFEGRTRTAASYEVLIAKKIYSTTFRPRTYPLPSKTTKSTVSIIGTGALRANNTELLNVSDQRNPG